MADTCSDLTECHEPIGRSAFIVAHLHRSFDVMREVTASLDVQQQVLDVAMRCTSVLRAGGKIMLAGNGGSAGDAQHIAGEFLSRWPLAALALSADVSVLTAVGNDYGYVRVFERQILGLGWKGDLFIAISTSGRSPNILAAFTVSQSLGIDTMGFSGAGQTPMVSLCDAMLQAPSTSTPLIQQIHLVADHATCGLVEKEICGD